VEEIPVAAGEKVVPAAVQEVEIAVVEEEVQVAAPAADPVVKGEEKVAPAEVVSYSNV
jgi:hypothetical protein